ncbi:Protein of uncharacterised function DUF72 [Legionella wadsworthii]|uniref:Protein of uncharacterized function DUF72 n=1 Tax=Legionella wadsworthii TaxID=28088 RepID=A0A378LTG8_9GAMM|nr:DUF72 domain-containing protein [Legionella wadsworthii]STY29640.1 Protein of uncharacterised function DUF72 [Legionella wadsworthii]
MQRDKIHIGTSGWQYSHWYGSFYPKNINFHKQLITFYAQKFQTVELNTSFYHVPSEKTIEEWIKATPQDFIFSYKVNRYITHMKKLNDLRKR